MQTDVTEPNIGGREVLQMYLNLVYACIKIVIRFLSDIIFENSNGLK